MSEPDMSGTPGWTDSNDRERMREVIAKAVRMHDWVSSQKWTNLDAIETALAFLAMVLLSGKPVVSPDEADAVRERLWDWFQGRIRQYDAALQEMALVGALPSMFLQSKERGSS